MARSSEMLTRVMARWPREPTEFHRWERGPNYALVLEFNPHVLGIELAGSVTRESLEALEAPMEQLFARSSTAHLFWDAESLDTHDSEVRDAMVGLLREHRDRWQGLHVLYTSALVGMTVGALSLLFRSMKGHRDHATFYAAVEDALARTDAAEASG